MNSLVLGEIVSSMEFLFARLTLKLLFAFMLPRVTQPVVFPHESLSTCIASESANEKEGK